jgi:SAM-dependent methyltransferase
MVEPDPDVLGHYESIREEDRMSEGLGRLELLRVQEVLGRWLPKAPATIVDIGGAAGVHARWLASLGNSVRIIDITPRHVARATHDLAQLGVKADVGDARSLPLGDEDVDVALLFGPLYHLVERGDRLQALQEAKRVVRPGGIVVVAAISKFASLFDGLARGFLFDPDFVPIVERDLVEGQHRNPERRAHWFTTAFFHHPDELRQEVTDAGLEVRELVGLEGLGGWLPHLASRWDDPASFERIVWAARVIEDEPSLLGLSAHMLLISSKP